jgi:transmembrane sensor
MTEQSVQSLVKKFLRGESSPAERRKLAQWIEQAATDAELKQILEKAWQLYEPVEKLPKDKADAILSIILSHEGIMEQRVVPVKFLWLKRLSVAAVLIVALGIAGYFMFFNSQQKEIAKVVPTRALLLNDAYAGSNKAELTLSDGSIITLDSSSGALTTQGNIQVMSQLGELIYKGSENAGASALYNTLSTKRGGLYPVTLSDGTKVWLNSVSSIRYPVAFNASERLVEVTGEAYFEVAKNPEKPFKVILNGMEIRVLGTHFNVNGYTDETTVKTTLLEGSLKVTKGTASVLLTPGQRAVLNGDGKINLVKAIDPEESVAWKDGYFHFNNTSLEMVMRQLSRWYDVEIVYESKEPEQFFNGDFKSNVNLSEVLKILEKSQVHSRVEGKSLIITH